MLEQRSEPIDDVISLFMEKGARSDRLQVFLGAIVDVVPVDGAVHIFDMKNTPF